MPFDCNKLFTINQWEKLKSLKKIKRKKKQTSKMHIFDDLTYYFNDLKIYKKFTKISNKKIKHTIFQIKKYFF